MKVLIIGSKYRVITFANQLVKRDVSVHIISNRKMKNGQFGKADSRIVFHEELINKLKKDSKNKYMIISFLYTIIKLKCLIRKINPDIIHAFFIQGHGWFSALTKFHPFVLTTMGSDINSNQGASDTLVKKIMLSYTVKRADLVTVQSRQSLEEIRNLNSNIELIYFRAGYDSDLFFPTAKPEYLYRPKEKPEIVSDEVIFLGCYYE